MSVFARLSLSAKLTAMAVAALLILSLSTYLATRQALIATADARAQSLQESNMRVAWDVLHRYGKGFRVADERLFVGDQPLDGNFAPVDHIKELVGGTATIFRGDLRVSTNVKKEDGSRAIGTPLAAGPVYDAVLKQGQPYRGTAEILGKPYFTAYDPIKDAGGKVIGVLYVGLPATESKAETAGVLRQIALVGVGITLLAAGLCMWAARTMFRPLTGMRDAMRRLASGDDRVTVPGLGRKDEVGEMAAALEVFRESAIAKRAADTAREAAERDQQAVIAALETSLAALAAGDLSRGVQGSFPPAYAGLKTSFDAAVAELRALIGAVVERTTNIRANSGEIAEASESLARRTEGAAASLEQTTAAITQIDGRLREAAAAAGQTVHRADGAIAAVSGGRAITDEAVQAMTRVADSAKGIDDVIEGLDKIAFQTRVLAMNAAVEAGRAGDAGRGFAVVADLVSALAMRAEEEAKRARNQLSVTQSDIGAAVGAVQRVDGALADISDGVGAVHTLLGRMAEDNQAQSGAISEISAAIGSMDQATQQNAAMVEETSAAARALSAEVHALAEQAARFNTGAAPARVPASTTPIRASARPAAAHRAPAPAPVLADAGDDWASF